MAASNYRHVVPNSKGCCGAKAPGRDGRIRYSDTVAPGGDPNPPRYTCH